MLNSNNIPKYVQIYNYLDGLIKRGRIKVGDRLPTEEKIAADFKVNRMTVRQAIDEFVVKKMVVRERGREVFWSETVRRSTCGVSTTSQALQIQCWMRGLSLNLKIS